MTTSTKTKKRVVKSSLWKKYKTQPHCRSFFQLCSNTLVVVQEIALSCYFLARHHLTTIQEEYGIDITTTKTTTTSTTYYSINILNDASTFFIVLALVLVLIYSTTTANQINNQITRTTKLQHRSKDSIVLAILLRFISSTIQSLTASYSSDTVELLSLLAMFIHVLFCDFTYANGFNSTTATRQQQTTINSNNNNSNKNNTNILKYDDQQQQQLNITNRRLPFLGGTVSLNAALFATILLVSRIDSNMIGYSFVTLSIVMFALYPATRNAITVTYPTNTSIAMWLITGCVCLSTVLLLMIIDTAYDQQQQQQQEETGSSTTVQYDHRSYIYQFYIHSTSSVPYFLGICIIIGFIIPAWKYHVQQYKVQFCGPWDIPTKEYMQLDYNN